MCVALMGPGAADTMAGKTLMRGLRRAIADMPEHDLRENLTDIRDRLTVALDTPETFPYHGTIETPAWIENASIDLAAFADGD